MKLKIVVRALRDLFGTHGLWLLCNPWSRQPTFTYPYYTVRRPAHA